MSNPLNLITKTVGARLPIGLWNKFKAEVYKNGYRINEVLQAMIRLFLEDPEFRAKVLDELNEG